MDAEGCRGQTLRIAQGLLGLGDITEQLASDLRHAGFSAFAPYQRFIESFATGPADIERHRRYSGESFKALTAEAAPEPRVVYDAQYLEELKEFALHSPLLDDPNTARIPQLFLDPCRQNCEAMGYLDKEEHARREHAMLAQRARQLEIEAERHATGLSRRYPMGMLAKPTRFRFAAEVIERESRDLGFEPTGLKASTGHPIVRKTVADWDIIWAIHERDLFFYTPFEGLLMLGLGIRPASVSKTRGEAARGGCDIIEIMYSLLVEGFALAYRSFSDLDILETHIKAHLQLYRLVAPNLESAIRNAAT